MSIKRFEHVYKNFNISILTILLLAYSCSAENEKNEEIIQEETSNFECTIEGAVQKDNRMVGIDLLDLSESGDFNNNISLGSELGIDFIALHLNWTSIETSPFTYSDPQNALELLSQVALDNNLKLSLTLRPIDLSGKTVPSDLDTTRFNEIALLDRFQSLVDFVFTKVDPSVLLNLQIGNEIDGYDTTNEPESFWTDYGVFLEEMTTYLHTNYPNLKIGYTGTLKGLLERPVLFNTLVQNVDILGVTYYPLEPNFDVSDPDSVFTDFNSLIATFPNTTIYLQEVGYQTSEANKSNENKQAEFFCNFFKSWDMYKDAIATANIVRLNDLSTTSAMESAVPYGISDSSFLEYLRTLGLRNYENTGTNKNAFSVIKDNLQGRGW